MDPNPYQAPKGDLAAPDSEIRWSPSVAVGKFLFWVVIFGALTWLLRGSYLAALFITGLLWFQWKRLRVHIDRSKPPTDVS